MCDDHSLGESSLCPPSLYSRIQSCCQALRISSATSLNTLSQPRQDYKQKGWKQEQDRRLLSQFFHLLIEITVPFVHLIQHNFQNGLGTSKEYQAEAQRSSRCHRIHPLSPTLPQRSSTAQINHSSLTQAAATTPKRVRRTKAFETSPRARL